MSIKSIAFIGLGYIGLPTAVVMANSGLNVTGVDVKDEVVARVNAGEITIVEPGLQKELRAALSTGNFRASTEVPSSDAYIIAVPTPFTDERDVDMSYIYSAAASIAPQLKAGQIVILESTSPPGTTAKMAERILELRPDLAADGSDDDEQKGQVFFAHCPERILPGEAMSELRTNDRIIGGMSPQATVLATEIYRSFCDGELLASNDITAEMAKLTENSFRDVNIAFANELSVICDNLGINVWELIELANHHPRVNILQPGPGVGGHCIAVDPWFIVSADSENSRLIRTAREVNDAKPKHVVDQVISLVEEVKPESIAVLGLAFKADIDDLRQSPALTITEALAKALPDNVLRVVEPNVEVLPDELAAFSNIHFEKMEDALEISDVVVLLVDHSEFKKVSANVLVGKHLVDTKGLWRLKQ